MLTSQIRSAVAFVLLFAGLSAASADALLVADRPVLGSVDAPVVIVEFSDYECTFCKSFFTDRLPEIKRKFIDTGKARLEFRDFPLSRHPRSRPAAAAAACADRQDRFFDMHETLFNNQGRFSDQQLRGFAAELDLDLETYDACIQDPAVYAQIDQDLAAARQARISGTPAFLIGVQRGDRITGTLIVGLQPGSVFDAEISEYYEQETGQAVEAEPIVD
jgi:protein-disulfide isomerase